ncbi:VOC family protein [Frankia sp. R82]|uniref:VOC family protein n=1 Tax=Frankia sp. R82 TaxID=2950553 RepID=UPI002043A2B9|nr:VOC family protein [Frankia sp. R82]MCM3886085.1 VOC family protein [Frankia sp. R82]
MTVGPGAKFAFMKVVVADLAAATTFYRAVCGYEQSDSVKADMAGRPIEEIVLRRPGGPLELVVLTYLDGPAAAANGAVIAFDTDDLDAFQTRVLAAGGTIVQAIEWLEIGPNRMRIAFFADPEGNLLEVMER